MKPNWKDAPSWANYLSMDMDGDWYWYENKPSAGNIDWLSDGGLSVPFSSIEWSETLESRPE